MRKLCRSSRPCASELFRTSSLLDVRPMCITAIIGMIAAESNNVELQTVLAEHSRLVRKGVPAPEVGPVVARNVYCCPTGKQVLTLEEAVETGRMKGGVALGLGEVVHVVDYIAVPVRSTEEDDEREVVYLFLVLLLKQTLAHAQIELGLASQEEVPGHCSERRMLPATH